MCLCSEGRGWRWDQGSSRPAVAGGLGQGFSKDEAGGSGGWGGQGRRQTVSPGVSTSSNG